MAEGNHDQSVMNANWFKFTRFYYTAVRFKIDFRWQRLKNRFLSLLIISSKTTRVIYLVRFNQKYFYLDKNKQSIIAFGMSKSRRLFSS